MSKHNGGARACMVGNLQYWNAICCCGSVGHPQHGQFKFVTSDIQTELTVDTRI